MSVAEDTTQIPTPIPDIVALVDAPAAAIVNDLQSTISNTFEAPENTTKAVLEESQSVIDETSKLIEEIATNLVGKSDVVVDDAAKVVEETAKPIIEEAVKVVEETTKLIEETAKPIIEETPKLVEETSKMIVDETTILVESVVESVVKTGENIASIVSEEEKRLTDTISRLSIEMEKPEKNGTGFFAKIHKFVKLITSCTHGADKSVIIPVVVKTDYVDVKVANVV